MGSQLATVSEVGQAVQTNTILSPLLTATSLSQAESSSANRQLVRRLDLEPGRLGQRDQPGRGSDADQKRDRLARQRGKRAANEGDAIDLVQSAIWSNKHRRCSATVDACNASPEPESTTIGSVEGINAMKSAAIPERGGR